jgi:hypothetical protein
MEFRRCKANGDNQNIGILGSEVNVHSDFSVMSNMIRGTCDMITELVQTLTEFTRSENGNGVEKLLDRANRVDQVRPEQG